MRTAVINSATGIVDNIILLADPTLWSVPPGHQIIQSDTANIGDTWNGSVFVPAPQPSPPPFKLPPTPRQWLERLAPETQAAIASAAAKDTTGALLLLLLKAAGNPSIDVTSAETIAGVQAMVSAGVITAQDQQTLLAP